MFNLIRLWPFLSSSIAEPQRLDSILDRRGPGCGDAVHDVRLDSRLMKAPISDAGLILQSPSQLLPLQGLPLACAIVGLFRLPSLTGAIPLQSWKRWDVVRLWNSRLLRLLFLRPPFCLSDCDGWSSGFRVSSREWTLDLEIPLHLHQRIGLIFLMVEDPPSVFTLVISARRFSMAFLCSFHSLKNRSCSGKSSGCTPNTLAEALNNSDCRRECSLAASPAMITRRSTPSDLTE